MADKDGRDSTDTKLLITIAGSGLVSVAALAMHVRTRRAQDGHRKLPPVLAASIPRTYPVSPPVDTGPEKPRLAPPPLSIPPNHNALDSVWSVSVVPAEDPVIERPAPYAAPPLPPVPPLPPRPSAEPPTYADAPHPEPEQPRLAPPPLSIPPNHNALDSVWSISVVLGEDDDAVDDTTAGHEAVPMDPPPSSGRPDRQTRPSWWRQDGR